MQTCYFFQQTLESVFSHDGALNRELSWLNERLEIPPDITFRGTVLQIVICSGNQHEKCTL